MSKHWTNGLTRLLLSRCYEPGSDIIFMSVLINLYNSVKQKYCFYIRITDEKLRLKKMCAES